MSLPDLDQKDVVVETAKNVICNKEIAKNGVQPGLQPGSG